MKIFVGYGYNERDAWIERQVYPVLRAMGFSIVDGHDMVGNELSMTVKSRIDQVDAAVGFFTLREGMGDAEFTSHMWVRDELVYADAKGKPIIPIKEEGVHTPENLMGNRQYIPLKQADRLACVVDLVSALGRRNMRRIRLDPANDELRASLWKWRMTPAFTVRYRTQDEEGLESEHRVGRLEVIDAGFYLNVTDLPKKAYVEVEGLVTGDVKFSSGWVSAEAVQVKIF